MKAIRIIAIVLMLMATACRSSAGEATQIVSSDAELPASDGYAAADEPTDGTRDRGDAAVPEPEAEPADGDGGEREDDAGTDTDGATDDADRNGISLGGDSAGGGFLARVSDATVTASTGRFEGRFVLEAAPGSTPNGGFELTMSGAYDLDADAFDISVDLSGLAALIAAEASPAEADMVASMFAEPAQLRTVGDTAWVRWGLLGTMFGAMTADGGMAWIELEVDDAASMTDQFGVDSLDSPTDLLRTLADLDATVTEIGRETVRGAETTHYRISIDLEAVAARLSPEEQAALDAELPAGISGALPIDLWMDDDDLLRRLVIELDDFDSMGLGSEAEGIGSMLIEFELYDVGEPVAIQPPPADQVISSDELGFDLGGGF